MSSSKQSAGGGWASLLKVLPLHKLRRLEVANLSFETIALFFTVKFAAQRSNEPGAAILLLVVVGVGLFCIMWACKQ